VKLYFDENCGGTITSALQKVLSAAQRPENLPRRTKDVDWIGRYSADDQIVITRDTNILKSPTERAAVIAAGTGLIFVPEGLRPFGLLRLLLRRWEWLQALEAEARPFAFSLESVGGPDGKGRVKRLRV
jgi:hypothetical protein